MTQMVELFERLEGEGDMPKMSKNKYRSQSEYSNRYYVASRVQSEFTPAEARIDLTTPQVNGLGAAQNRKYFGDYLGTSSPIITTRQRFKPGWDSSPRSFNGISNLENLDTQLQDLNLLVADENSITLSNASNKSVEQIARISANRSTKVFDQIYVNNRSAKGHAGFFRKGVIAGTSIVAMEEPDDRGKPVFEYAVHDKIALNPDAVHDGYVSNINSVKTFTSTLNSADPAKLNEAVVIHNEQSDDYSTHLLFKSQQFFPFMFVTENRSDTQQTAFFQATISNLSESFNPSWDSKSYFGRTEKVHTYIDSDRTIDISFAIMSHSMRSLQNIWERINWLAQQTYGEHDENNKLTAGPIVRMTIGDIYDRIPGYIRSLSYDWNLLGPGGKWEMTRGLRMPQGLTVSLSFQVIHEDLPSRNYNFYSGLSNGSTIDGTNMGVSVKDGDRWNNLIPTKGDKIPYISSVMRKNTPVSEQSDTRYERTIVRQHSMLFSNNSW